MAAPKQCFISYSHHDHSGFDRLLVHVTPVAHLFNFRLWYDRRIRPGYYWNDFIRSAIVDLDIYILLVTNDFFASDYILRQELPAMIERHQKHNALLIPVIFRNSLWRGFFGDYIEVTPKNAKHNLVPVCDWSDRERALAEAGKAIFDAVEEWFGAKPSSIFSPSTTLPNEGRP